MPKQRKLHDKFFKLAKAEGYAARSAYKLLEIQDRRRLLRRDMIVLDLGCAPGSWMQVAAERVGPKGCVIGLDLQAVTIDLPEHAITLVGDAFTFAPSKLAEIAGVPGSAGDVFDVILSDMAPNTTGAGDHFRSVALCRRVLEIVPSLLVRGGSLVMKVFEGEIYPELVRETAEMFREAKGLKPLATREVSKEMFIIGMGFHGPSDEAPRQTVGPRRQPTPVEGWGAPKASDVPIRPPIIARPEPIHAYKPAKPPLSKQSPRPSSAKRGKKP